MQFLIASIQIVGCLLVLAGTLFCLAELIATMRVIARTEDREERLVAASGLVWSGGGPIMLMAFYTLVTLLAQLVSHAWYVLPVGLVAGALPFVLTGLKGRKRLANTRIQLRHHAIWTPEKRTGSILSGK